MKIRKYGLGTLASVLFVLLLDMHFYYLFTFSGYMKVFLDIASMVTGGMMAIILYFYTMAFHRSKLVEHQRWIYLYGVLVIVSFCAILLFTTVQYPAQKFFDTLKIGCRYLYPLFFVPFLFLFERDGGIKNILRVLNIGVFLWYVYSFFQIVAYNRTGNVLFSFMDYFHGTIILRHGNLRIGPGAFGNIMLLLNLNSLLYEKTKKKVFTLVMVLMGIYHLLVIQQTRMWIIVCAICVSVEVFFYKGTKRQQITRALLVLVVGFYLANSTVIVDFIGTFTSTSREYQGSSIARDYAITYFLSKVAENPVFGYGWPGDASYSSVAHGSLGTAWTNDVGIIGALAELGLFIIPLYIFPVFRMFKIYLNNKKYLLTDEKMMLLILIIYVVGSSATLMITDKGRCMAFPVIIAIFEYYNCHGVEKNKC